MLKMRRPPAYRRSGLLRTTKIRCEFLSSLLLVSHVVFVSPTSILWLTFSVLCGGGPTPHLPKPPPSLCSHTVETLPWTPLLLFLRFLNPEGPWTAKVELSVYCGCYSSHGLDLCGSGFLWCTVQHILSFCTDPVLETEVLGPGKMSWIFKWHKGSYSVTIKKKKKKKY